MWRNFLTFKILKEKQCSMEECRLEKEARRGLRWEEVENG